MSRLPLPSPVRVGGKLYAFRYDKSLLSHELLGQTSTMDGVVTIAVQSARIPKRLIVTVMHEVLHAISSEWQLEEFNDNSPEAERVILAFSTGLLQVLPQLEDWLRETRRIAEAE